MLTANDGHAYVVKFANNPQSLRVLANEWLGCSIGRALGLTIPEPAILYVPATLVESSPSLVIQSSNSTLKCSHGLAFGSRFISEGQLFDYLPDSTLSRVENVRECAGVFALDRWLCNCDGRQVVFCESERRRGFRLKGQGKTGHAGSLQNRPCETARDAFFLSRLLVFRQV